MPVRCQSGQHPADRLGADFRGAPDDSTTPEPAGAPEPAEDDVFEQKAVRLAKRERLIAERADAAGGAYPVVFRSPTRSRRFAPATATSRPEPRPA